MDALASHRARRGAKCWSVVLFDDPSESRVMRRSSYVSHRYFIAYNMVPSIRRHCQSRGSSASLTLLNPSTNPLNLVISGNFESETTKYPSLRHFQIENVPCRLHLDRRTTLNSRYISISQSQPQPDSPSLLVRQVRCSVGYEPASKAPD
jgi:hypothetical protein